MAESELSNQREFLDLVKWAESKGRGYWREEAPLQSVINARSNGRFDLLFREGNFQIERVDHAAFEVIPMHRHPQVDSYELSLCGSGAIFIGGHRLILDERYTPWRPFFVSRKCWHGGISGAHGGAFLSVQHWHIAPIKSVKDNWESRNGE